MKFAGPNMGAALGSGVMGGLASAQDMAAREELARDTSAMATYSKLVSSGEWEPVGKEGVKGGGVLRVGNVGFLKKVNKPVGIDWDAQKAMSLMQYRKDQTRQADERLARQREDKGPYQIFANRQTGRRVKVHKNEPLPQGAEWYRESGFNLPGTQAIAKRADQREDVGFLERRLTDIDNELNSSGLMSMVGNLTPEKIKSKPMLEKAYKTRQKLLKERTHVLSLLEGAVGRSLGRVGGNTPFGGTDSHEGLNKYKESGAAPERVEAIETILTDPKKRSIFDKIVGWLKGDESIEAYNKIADRVIAKDKKKTTPFATGTRVAP